MVNATETHILNPNKYDEVNEANVIPSSFEPGNGEKGKVKFTLTDPAIVRVFVRPRERRFIIIKTLLDFDELEAGTHELEWDGLDSKGNLLDPRMYRITIQAQPLRGSIDEESVPWDPDPHAREEKVMYIAEQEKRIHAHFVHDEDKCKEIKITITSPKNGDTIKGKVKVVREIDASTRGYVAHHGHSARFYVDYMLLQESKDERELVSEWVWDTETIPPGKHVLTATACDHHDHMGSDSIIVNIEK